MQTPMFGQTHMLWHGCKRFNTNFRHWLPSGSEGIRLGLVALTVCSRSFGVVLYIPIHTYCDIDMYILYVQIHICRHLVTAARGWSSVSGRNWERPFFSCFFFDSGSSQSTEINDGSTPELGRLSQPLEGSAEFTSKRERLCWSECRLALQVFDFGVTTPTWSNPIYHIC
jgi:hypothetical protein